MATAPTVTHSNVLELRAVSNYASADDVLPLTRCERLASQFSRQIASQSLPVADCWLPAS
jgi:hypothetical protein